MQTTEIAETLARAHLDEMYEKYLVIGFHSKSGDDFFTNCTTDQLGLLLALFHERVLAAQNAKPSTDSSI